MPRRPALAFSLLLACSLTSSLARSALADVPSPDPEGCQGACKKGGEACACRNGNAGSCVVVSTPRPGCPGGPPCASETLWCAPAKPKPVPDSPAAAPSKRWGCSAGLASRGTGGSLATLGLAGLTVLALAGRARRRR